MSDHPAHRRQPPSPLVFSPETVLPSPHVQSGATVTGHAPGLGSGSNTVSMPFVRRHVTRRLKAAKQECDRELQRVTNSITAFFEERLREAEHEQESEREARENERERDRESQVGDPEPLREAFVLQPAELRSALQFDEVSSDGGYDAEPEGSHHSRQRASLDEGRPSPPTLTHWASSPGLLTASLSSTSPNSLRRHPTLPREKPLNIPASTTATSSPIATPVTTPPPETVGIAVSPRKSAPVASQSSQWSGQSLANRRLSRTIHLPSRPPVRSGQSSRSTSRSRSPLPRGGFGDTSMSTRRSSRILVDDPVDPIMTTLYDIIAVATDITDMSINQLTAQPKICEQLVQRVQNIGKAWDEHPDWHGRNWYVQVLLAIASLSRVVEWWEAEKQFWNFDDNDDEQEEPLTFVMKPAEEEEVMAPTPSVRGDTESSPFKLLSEDDARLRMTRTSSQGRRSRDEAPKDLTNVHGQPEHPKLTSKFSDSTESARVLATERLRLQAEQAQNQNIVMELSMDGDHVIWINYAWRSVIGSDPDELIGSRISRTLAPSDWHVFRDATRRLQDDDSRTVEVKFKLILTEQDTDVSSPTTLYQPMEGKGMLMVDHEDGHPSHSMWVVRPAGSPEYHQAPPSILLETGDVGEEPAHDNSLQVGFGDRSGMEPVTPFPIQRPINTQLILCRICECSVPQWYFEKHNETCSEVHRLEAEIAECNESISELRSTIRELQTAMDRSSPMAPEYRGMPIFTPATSPSPSPLQLLRAPLKMKRTSVKKMQRQLLEQLEEILQIAVDVSIPSLKEDQTAEPIEQQRLLSPPSESRMVTVRRWVKPIIEDAALTQLVEDADRIMKQKIENVIRLENTIRYSEKIRHEWEERVEQTLSELESTAEEDEEDYEEGEEDEQAEAQQADELLVGHALTRVAEETPAQVMETPVGQIAEQAPAPVTVPAQETVTRASDKPSTPDPGPFTPLLGSTAPALEPSVLVPKPPVPLTPLITSQVAHQTVEPLLEESISQDIAQAEERATEQAAGDVAAQVPERAVAESPTPQQVRQPAEIASEDDRSSIVSDYTYNNHAQSSELTPVSVSSPAQIAEGKRGRSSSVSFNLMPPLAPAAPIPAYPPTFQTRSSTPSSVSSPLATAAPIIASDMPPPMELNEYYTHGTIRSRPSPHNLEPKLLITPPLSPMVTAQDVAATAKKGSRRHSTAAPILSPTVSLASMPLSPRLPSIAPSSRTTPTSIKDFEIIKPISKGAFGSVFLAKKKVTGDYFAIKVLKKADMIAKNQITNVKAERMILMKQAESPFVAKLYFTFQSKENLYLVMEYLNGGDCAALIKSLGNLPEEWTRNYIAEVTLGLEYLHQRGIVHRDLKPDNLLIDQHGHLKLTDFGLSRIGLLGRQTRESQIVSDRGLRARTTRYSPSSRPPSMDSAISSSPMFTVDLHLGGSYFNQRGQSIPRPGSSPYLPLSDDYSESSGSESLPALYPLRRTGSKQLSDSPLQSFATELTTDLRSHPTPGGTPPGEGKVVGTPDYLAPETILGLRGDDAAVDWWALGVITYEFLYGIPPFHDETPEKVFENILSGHVEWHDDYLELSDEAKDFIQRLMTLDPSKRLGANGADEVKAHPFFNGIEWDKVTTTEAAFIPQVTDPESTDYFDPRGAVLQLFHDDSGASVTKDSTATIDHAPLTDALAHPASAPAQTSMLREAAPSPSDDDFGSFSFKNLPVLKQANDDVIRKLKTDQLTPLSQTLSDPTSGHSRRKSISGRVKKPASVVIATGDPVSKPSPTNPPSPATSTSSIASSASRGPPTPGSSVGGHIRKPSDFGAVERFKLNHIEGDGIRRNSMPSRLRTASISTNGDSPDAWNQEKGAQPPAHYFDPSTPPSSSASIDLKRAPDPNDRAVTCLLAEDNPITAKIIETLLMRLGCRCVVVADGSEAISVAMGDIKFDVILMDLHMPILDGEGAARYIKSTANKNSGAPIIAVSAYSGSDAIENNGLFASYIAKPVQKADLVAAMRQLGFKTSSVQGRGLGAKAATTLAVR